MTLKYDSRLSRPYRVSRLYHRSCVHTNCFLIHLCNALREDVFPIVGLFMPFFVVLPFSPSLSWNVSSSSWCHQLLYARIDDIVHILPHRHSSATASFFHCHITYGVQRKCVFPCRLIFRMEKKTILSTAGRIASSMRAGSAERTKSTANHSGWTPNATEFSISLVPRVPYGRRWTITSRPGRPSDWSIDRMMRQHQLSGRPEPILIGLPAKYEIICFTTITTIQRRISVVISLSFHRTASSLSIELLLLLLVFCCWLSVFFFKFSGSFLRLCLYFFVPTIQSINGSED